MFVELAGGGYGDVRPRGVKSALGAQGRGEIVCGKGKAGKVGVAEWFFALDDLGGIGE